MGRGRQHRLGAAQLLVRGGHAPARQRGEQPGTGDDDRDDGGREGRPHAGGRSPATDAPSTVRPSTTDAPRPRSCHVTSTASVAAAVSHQTRPAGVGQHRRRPVERAAAREEQGEQGGARHRERRRAGPTATPSTAAATTTASRSAPAQPAVQPAREEQQHEAAEAGRERGEVGGRAVARGVAGDDEQHADGGADHGRERREGEGRDGGARRGTTTRRRPDRARPPSRGARPREDQGAAK